MSPSDAAPLRSLPVILASRSPRRFELLAHLVPADRIRVLPPSSAEEVGFTGLTEFPAITDRLLDIAATKCDDVLRQLGAAATSSIVIAADTVVLVETTPASSPPRPRTYLALGQPLERAWRETNRRWFLDHYAGRTHSVLTGVNIATPSDRHALLVETRVTFRSDAAEFVDWYLDTHEPLGKAGGYAIQGAGSLFIERVEGSLTNVIGLPLHELLTTLRALEVT